MSEKIDTTMTAPTPASAPPKNSFLRKARPWLFTAAGVVFLIGGALNIYKGFAPNLPGCSSQTIKDTIHDIFKQKKLQLTSLSGIKTRTESSSEKTCQADIATPNQKATISYQIFWQGSSPQVRIAHVQLK